MKKVKENKKHVAFRIEKELHDFIIDMSKEYNRSVTDTFTFILKEHKRVHEYEAILYNREKMILEREKMIHLEF